ncbi:MAG: hypothetical protein ACM30F_05060 [Nitrospirota bacterium]
MIARPVPPAVLPFFICMMFYIIDGMAGHAENTCHIPYMIRDKIYSHQGDKNAANYRREFLVFSISVRLLVTKKMTIEIGMMPGDFNILLLNKASSFPAAFPGVLATVAVGASTALFTTGFVLASSSLSPVPSLIMTAVSRYFSGTDWGCRQKGDCP